MNPTSSSKHGLTKREQEILFYIADGLSSKQIAARLFVSKNTIDNHRGNMLKKLAARNSAELIRIALLS